jgi:hypothetical protein
MAAGEGCCACAANGETPTQDIATMKATSEKAFVCMSVLPL